MRKTANCHQAMNCKNCEAPLGDNSQYCSNCGAVIVSERITVKKIWYSFTDQFIGWDNKYLRTVLQVFTKPEVVIKSYLGGTRKKYMAPFALLAINTAIAMLIFNQFSESYLEITDSFNATQYELIEDQADPNHDNAEFQKQKQSQFENARKIQEGLLKYFNIFTFLLIPFYALIAFLVFRKPYNYGEHLVIVAYIQGLLFIVSILLFLLSVWVDPLFYSISFFFAIFFYLYTYGRLYKHSFLKLVVLFFKFIGVMVLLAIVFTIIMVVVVLAQKFFGY